jgi:translin
MKNLDTIAEHILAYLSDKNAARDRALERSRMLVRHCAHAIRAVHRDEREAARDLLAQARAVADSLRADLEPYPDLYHAGYSQDALKELAEAYIVYAITGGETLPAPDAIGVDYAAYLNGLGEAAGELRRRCLDIIRHDHSEEAERLLAAMDDIYGLLVTVDYPDAITGGLRRTADMVRGVTERTRGDLTTSLRQQRLQEALRKVEGRGGGESEGG